MARDWDDRYDRSGRRGGYDDNRGYRGDRDWGDRASDEVKSWFGDDDAERRRRQDERRDRAYDYGSRSSYGSDYYGRPAYRDEGYRVSGAGPYSGSYDYDRGYGRSSYGRGSGYEGGGFGSSGYGLRSGASHDRGFMERAGDEVRAWFGDEDAERRRRQDERDDYRREASHSDDYRYWRSEQIRKLDKDYEDYASERRQKFANEFDTWRSSRPQPSVTSSGSSTYGSSGTAGSGTSTSGTAASGTFGSTTSKT